MGFSLVENRSEAHRVDSQILPLVSVIIPSHQHGAYVGEAIESVLQQTYPRYEVIVVDDGSTDCTQDVLAKYGDAISVSRIDHRNAAAARNAGIRVAKGEYIAFLDADDVWLPDKLARQIALLEHDRRLGLVFSDYWIFAEQGAVLGRGFEKHPPRRGMVHSALFQTYFIMTLTVVVRRSCLEEVGLFDESIVGVEDLDLWLRICRRFEVDFVAEPLASYRVSPNQISRRLELMWRNLLPVLERAIEQDQSIGSIGRHALDKCFYNLYLHLSAMYVKKGLSEEARSALRRYLRLRGRTFWYCAVWLVSQVPYPLLRAGLALRDSLSRRPGASKQLNR